MVFIPEMERVYCAVRTEYLSVIYVTLRLQNRLAVPQTVSRRRLTAETGVDLMSVPVKFVVDEMEMGRVYFRVLLCSPETLLHQCPILIIA